MSRAATTPTVGDQITTPAHAVYAHDGGARDGLAVRPGGAAAGAAAAARRPASSKRRSGTSAASRACAGPRSCRRAKRSRRSTKAACRRRWCVASTSSPTATSSTTPPMSWRSACPASARATRCAPSATRSSTAATPCSSCRPIASCRSSWRRSGIWSCRAPCGSSITSPCSFSTTSGYIQQSPEEAEILFTLLAERYERRSVFITSNLIFAQWDRIFRDQMATAAAIDRLVHHSVLLEFDVPSFRTEHAKRRGKATPVRPPSPRHEPGACGPIV